MVFVFHLYVLGQNWLSKGYTLPSLLHEGACIGSMNWCTQPIQWLDIKKAILFNFMYLMYTNKVFYIPLVDNVYCIESWAGNDNSWTAAIKKLEYCTVWTVNDVLSRSTPFFSKGCGSTQKGMDRLKWHFKNRIK